MKADRVANVLATKATIAVLQKSGYMSPYYAKILIRQAFIRGYKSGMARKRRIMNKKEKFINNMASLKRVADLMG
jgi:hypothetical protein